MMETHKIYIDYAITIISASYFYVSNALVSPDVDLIATDATSSLPLILSHPSPLSPPHHRMALQPMLLPRLHRAARSRISSQSMWVPHTGSGSRRRRFGDAMSIGIWHQHAWCQRRRSDRGREEVRGRNNRWDPGSMHSRRVAQTRSRSWWKLRDVGPGKIRHRCAWGWHRKSDRQRRGGALERQCRVGWSGTRRSGVDVLKGRSDGGILSDERERERAVSMAAVVEQNGRKPRMGAWGFI
jgi:hypothetical protein